MNNELKIEIPDDPINAADTVGRAIRIARQHWLPLIQFFFVPIFLYDLSETILVWQPDGFDVYALPSVSYWLMVVSFIVMCLSIWVIETRRFALLLYISSGFSNLNEALKAAKKRMWLILVLTIPVLACEIFGEAFFMLAQMVERKISAIDLPAEVHMYVVFAMLAMTILLYLPTLSVTIINAFFVSILVFDKCSVFSAVRRFFNIAIPMFFYFASYTGLMAVVHAIEFFPAAITTPLTFLLPKGLVTSVFELILTIVLETPIYSFLAAAITIGGACLYKQLCAALEGQDILDKLKLLDAKP